MIECIIKKVMDSIDLDSEDIIDKLKENNISFIKILNEFEDRECDKVEFSTYIIISYNNKKYILSYEGRAIAEISYERWVDTFGYIIEDYQVKEYNE